MPSLLEFLGYVFCFGNLLGGPIIEFADYRTFIRLEGPWARDAPRRVPIWGAMKQVCFVVLEFFLLGTLFVMHAMPQATTNSTPANNKTQNTKKTRARSRLLRRSCRWRST